MVFSRWAGSAGRASVPAKTSAAVVTRRDRGARWAARRRQPLASTHAVMCGLGGKAVLVVWSLVAEPPLVKGRSPVRSGGQANGEAVSRPRGRREAPARKHGSDNVNSQSGQPRRADHRDGPKIWRSRGASVLLRRLGGATRAAVPGQRPRLVRPGLSTRPIGPYRDSVHLRSY